MQTLQELVDAAIQSDAPHHHQLVLAPSWLTGAGSDPQEVWLALQTLGKLNATVEVLVRTETVRTALGKLSCLSSRLAGNDPQELWLVL